MDKIVEQKIRMNDERKLISTYDNECNKDIKDVNKINYYDGIITMNLMDNDKNDRGDMFVDMDNEDAHKYYTFKKDYIIDGYRHKESREQYITKIDMENNNVSTIYYEGEEVVNEEIKEGKKEVIKAIKRLYDKREDGQLYSMRELDTCIDKLIEEEVIGSKWKGHFKEYINILHKDLESVQKVSEFNGIINSKFKNNINNDFKNISKLEYQNEFCSIKVNDLDLCQDNECVGAVYESQDDVNHTKITLFKDDRIVIHKKDMETNTEYIRKIERDTNIVSDMILVDEERISNESNYIEDFNNINKDLFNIGEGIETVDNVESYLKDLVERGIIDEKFNYPFSKFISKAMENEVDTSKEPIDVLEF